MREDRSDLQAAAVLSGQIWLVEHNPDSPLSAPDRDALAQANVVLFDRALASLVIETLPLGTYAEPLPAGSSALSPRALEFAAEGWGVVQLVAATAARQARLHTVWPRANGAVLRPAPPAYAFTGNGLAG
jgi:hypothetical protein